MSMKPALILGLTCTLLLMAQVALTKDLCPTGRLANTILILPDTYIANNCTIMSGRTITVSIPANISSTYLTIQNSSVLTRHLLFTFPPATALSPPIFVTVKNNQFSLNTFLMIQNALPENSSLIIQGNQMSANLLTTNYACTLALFQVSVLYNATLTISDNVMSALDGTSVLTGLIYSQTLTVYPLGFVNIVRNQFNASSGAMDGCLVRMDTVYLQGQGSNIRVAENSFVSVSHNAVQAFYLSYLSADLNTRQTSWFLFNDNFVNISSSTAYGNALYFNNPYYVNFVIDNNNVYYTTGNAVQFGSVDKLYIFSISGNTFVRTQASIASAVVSMSTFIFYSNSTYMVYNNQVSAATVNTTDTPLLQVGEFVFVDDVDHSTLIESCGNTLPWSATPTLDQLFSAEILEAVVEQCPVESTRAPSFSYQRSHLGALVGLICFSSSLFFL